MIRHLTLCFFIAGIFSSCSKKDGSGDDGKPVNDSYLASARIIAPQSTTVDSFIYDANHRVTKFMVWLEDPTNQASDTTFISFSTVSGNLLPDHLTIAVSDDLSLLDHHQLIYDGQGRITKDTSLSGTGFVSYYSYSGNYIICRVLFNGAIDNYVSIDTLVMKDGNMVGQKLWTINQGVLEQQKNVVFDRGTAANPAYKADIASSVGPLLYILSVYNYRGFSDFLSRYVVKGISGVADGLPGGAGLSYSVSIDGSGRVAATSLDGSSVLSGVKTVFTYY